MAYKFNQDQLKWLDALESGCYEQTTEVLRDAKGFCCLGVACDVLGAVGIKNGNGTWSYDGVNNVAPGSIADKLRLIGYDGTIDDESLSIAYESLAEMNDEGVQFKEIAKFIRANPEKVFAS